MHGAARLAQTTAGAAFHGKQAALRGRLEAANTQDRKQAGGFCLSQRLKPKWSSLGPLGAQGTVFVNAVRSRHDLHPSSNPEYRRPAAIS